MINKNVDESGNVKLSDDGKKYDVIEETRKNNMMDAHIEVTVKSCACKISKDEMSKDISSDQPRDCGCDTSKDTSCEMSKEISVYMYKDQEVTNNTKVGNAIKQVVVINDVASFYLDFTALDIIPSKTTLSFALFCMDCDKTIVVSTPAITVKKGESKQLELTMPALSKER